MALDLKMGLDAKGMPVIGSIWEHLVERHLGPMKVEKVSPAVSYGGGVITFISPTTGERLWSGRADSVRGGQRYRLIAVKEIAADPTVVPPVPVLKKIARRDPLETEASMRAAEASGDLEAAKRRAIRAHGDHTLNDALLAEENAVSEGRVVWGPMVEALPPADRQLWQMRGLRKFLHYEGQMKNWLWYETK